MSAASLCRVCGVKELTSRCSGIRKRESLHSKISPFPLSFLSPSWWDMTPILGMVPLSFSSPLRDAPSRGIYWLPAWLSTQPSRQMSFQPPKESSKIILPLTPLRTDINIHHRFKTIAKMYFSTYCTFWHFKINLLSHLNIPIRVWVIIWCFFLIHLKYWK